MSSCIQDQVSWFEDASPADGYHSLEGANFHMTTLLEMKLDDQLVDNYIN